MISFLFKIIKDSAVGFILFVVIYRLGLDYIYKDIISPVFGYANLNYNPDLDSQIISWIVLCVFTVLMLPFRKKEGFVVSSSMNLFFFFSFIPMTSYWYCKVQLLPFMIACIIFWTLFLLLMLYQKVPNIDYMIRPNRAVIWFITILLSIVVIYISGVYAHFRFNFSLENVYDLRSEARQFNMPIILRYIWASASNVLPICMIYFLNSNYKKIAWLIFIVILLNFSINGVKSTLFKMIICLFLYYSFIKNYNQIIHILFVVIVLMAIAEFKYLGTIAISDVLIRRAFFIPNMLDGLFYDYIYTHGPTFYSHEGTNIAFSIGDIYFNDENMRCNNGLFTDAFINLGWIGVFLYPIIFSSFFKICEAGFKGIKSQILFFACIILVITFRSSLFTTSLATHGILLTCITLMFMPRTIK